MIEESKKSDGEEYESPFQNKGEKNAASNVYVQKSFIFKKNYKFLIYISRARSAVEKMMEKMGYREGEGLGRNKQGMSVALQVEKTGKRSGRIIHEKDVQKEPQPLQPAEVMKNPSKVVLLRVRFLFKF